MNELTKITIVTITYNSEKTIEKTIQSIISQKYDNIEYWIIDGASKDNTMALVQKYAQEYPYIKYASEPDKGISDAFNKGILKATGELIGLINSDDQLAENALFIIHERYSSSNADVIYGNTIVNDTANGLLLLKNAGKPGRLKYEMPFIHQSCFIKKSVYEECGYYSSEYKICMDFDMLARIFHKGYSFVNTNEVLSIFQYGGTSCKHPIKTINENMKIAKRYGLSAVNVAKYKLVHIPINIGKLFLSKLHIWRFIYRMLKGNYIIENQKKKSKYLAS